MGDVLAKTGGGKVKVNVYIVKKICGTRFDAPGRMSKIHDSTVANIYVQHDVIYNPTPEMLEKNDLPADATARLSRIINHELYHASRRWSLLFFSDNRLTRTFLETAIFTAALFGLFIFLDVLTGLAFAIFACSFYLLWSGSCLSRMKEEERAQGHEFDEISKELFGKAEMVKPWLFSRRFKNRRGNKIVKPTRLNIMAKKRSTKKTYHGGRPRYTYHLRGYFGDVDKFGFPKWIYDNKIGGTVENKYWGIKPHPTAKLWEEKGEPTCYG